MARPASPGTQVTRGAVGGPSPLPRKRPGKGEKLAHQATENPGRKGHRRPSPWSLIVKFAACIFVAEAAIMGVLLALPEASGPLEPFLDAVVLLLLLAPALYFLLVRPMAREITQRTRAEGQWRLSEERFRRAFDNAPIGMALLDPDGRFLQVNQALCEIFGYTEAELLRRSVREVAHAEDRADGEPVNVEFGLGAARGRHVERRYVRRDGGTVFGQLSVSAVTDPSGQPLYYIGQLEDITERKRAEGALKAARDELEERVRQRTAELEAINLDLLHEVDQRRQAEDALRESERKYSTLVESSLTGIFIHQDGKIAFVNKTGAEILGYGIGDLLGRDSFSLLHPNERVRVREIAARYLTGEPESPELEVRGLTRAGDVLWLNVRASRIEYQGRPAILGNVLDVTERKRAEAELAESQRQLKKVSVELLSAQERERGHMARELHDGLGQSLSALKFMVENALQQLGPDSPTPGAEALRAAIPRIQSTVQDVRRISMALHPSTLDDLGLLPTLGWFCREFQNAHPTIQLDRRVRVTESEIPDSLKIVIYRIIQEALNNVAKHSSAQRVEVRLDQDAEGFELTVEDDGVGFDLETAGSAPFETTLGLRSMKERAALSGGEFQIAAAPGAGVRVSVRWPEVATATTA